jgi:hypothetical protein
MRLEISANVIFSTFYFKTLGECNFSTFIAFETRKDRDLQQVKLSRIKEYLTR